MLFKSARLVNFRSYPRRSFEFHPNLNLIIGRNGSGKTNLLEALSVLATAKSFRARDGQMVSYTAAGYHLEGQLDSLSASVTYRLADKFKKLHLNTQAAKPEAYIGAIPTVLFEPTSLAIISGAPEDRRRFLNSVLSTVDRRYLKTLVQYRRVLKQRNSLLRKQSLNTVRQQVFAWDLKLVELADYLYHARLELINFLKPKLSKQYQQIARPAVKIGLDYQTTVQGEYSSNLLKQLTAGLERDALLGHTAHGPHRDDVIITFKGQPAGLAASRGETRTLVLALKLLELAFVEERVRTPPILLFDDVFSELDGPRRQFLLQRLAGYQAILTTTDLKGLKSALPRAHVMIELKTHAGKRQIVSAQKSPKSRSRPRPGTGRHSTAARAKVSPKNPRR